jgi:LacI family transcriptional regulator
MRVTLQAIADDLGLSKFAISRALAGKPGVSDETRRTVARRAEELGYLGRATRAKAPTIEIVFHDWDIANSELWASVQRGAQLEAARRGYDTVVRWTKDSRILPELARGAGGFILIGPHDQAMMAAARATGIHVVAIGGRPVALDTIDRIGTADAEAGAYVGNFLHGLGHRNMLYVHGEAGRYGRLERLRGFQDALAGLAGTSLRELAFDETIGEPAFRDEFVRILDQGQPPSAIFCGNDGVAVTVISQLLRLGMRVPEDVSVVGFADYACAMQISPNLTTIRMPSQEIGATAVQLLLARMAEPAGQQPPAQRVMLVQRLIERQSTGPAGSAAWSRRLRSVLDRLTA